MRYFSGVVSSDQVGRTDWTPIGFAELAVLMLSLRRLWYTGGIIHAGTKTVINCTFQMTCKLAHRLLFWNWRWVWTEGVGTDMTQSGINCAHHAQGKGRWQDE